MADADVGEPDENTPEEIAKLRNVLEKHKSAFINSGNALPKPARGVVCDIEIQPGTKPIAQRPRPIKLVNQLIKLMRYPLPLIDQLLDDFEAVMWLLSLDMASGFWAVLMTPRAKHVSAFICPLGHFQWVRMPFGLKNAPLIYQQVIDNCLWGFVRLPAHIENEVEPEVLEGVGVTPSGIDVRDLQPVEGRDSADEPTVFQLNLPASSCMGPVLGRSSYIDDIAAGTKTWDELCDTVDRLLYRLRYWGLSVSLPKSSFGKKAIEFLSHEVSRTGLRALPKVVKGINQLQFPSSLKGIQSFLGSLNYYHKFIEDYSIIASCLYELTDEQIKAGRDLDRPKLAFEVLKQKIQSPPILRHPDRSKPYSIILHANGWAVSAVLAQEHEGKLWPVRFTGRTLQDAELRYHESEKEVLALLRVLKTFYTLVAGHDLVVYTRFSVLKWIMTSKSIGDRLLKWATMLSPWTFEVRKIDRDQDGLASLFAAGITPREKLDEVAEMLAPTKASRSRAPAVSLEMLDAEYSGYLLSFDGAAKLKSNIGSASFVLWRLPAWEPVHAEGILLEGVTVNVAQVDELVIAGDSRIVIQQCQGEINCNTPHLQLLLNKFEALRVQVSSLRLVHVKREFNAAADYLTGVVLKSGRSMKVTAEDDLSQLAQLNTLPSKIMKPAADDSETVTSHKQDDDTNDDVSPHAVKDLARTFSAQSAGSQR
ncbi:hypothetical protein P43SY_011326 [Pythium insidiosum]|uniref:Reverse transcriptase n=1 Tax=Pythium insidiosum TaxID=114742 RepID=A0AAD5L9B5_PYTIN|nr:hypothetical protein P43SY_011326 [Pythium insidiosum]